MPGPLAIAAVPAAITAGSALLGSVANLFGQSAANSANIKMQRETNALNYQMFQEQQQFAKDQQTLALAYNDPSAQVARLREAGVNPAAVFGNGSISEASALNSPSGNPMVAPQVQPLDFSGIGSAAQFFNNAFFQNQLLAAQVDKTKQEGRIAQVQAEFEENSLENRLAMIANDKSKSDFERENARIHLRILSETQDKLIRQESLRTDILDKQSFELDLQNEAYKLANKIAEVDLHWRNKEKSSNFALFQANIKAALASARSADASAAVSYAEAAFKDAQSAGVKIDNTVKERTKDELVNMVFANREKVQSESEEAYWKSKTAQKEFRRGKWLSDRSGVVSSLRDLLSTDGY